ncbi:NTP transferase domain-containing protein [Rhodococcus pyridinivorans]|uniref:NTP transferase domain-containing protein n=1 Tax=Rhodococcus pyridinivorans TaxID=103816 RepID=UPI0021649593|nr:NTP transferase domain-containing protein [Rhodococcus pyridinivorans]UVT24756.1 NTP transferase domain-containing protein [Rhodococcus pyridinivorans]
MSTLTHVEAVIVAGGRATRMGGVDKPALTVGGRRMLDTALGAVEGCARVTVVGPHRDDLDLHVLQIQETPPGAGPVAALAAADPVADLVVTLAADLPFVTPTTVAALLEALNEDATAEAAFAVDDTGRVQFLLAAWRTPALAARLDSLGGDVANRPMKALLPERYVTVSVSEATDCDTPADLEAARAGSATARVAADPDRARRILREALSPLPSRTVLVEEARGATLAAPLVAVEALPRVRTSAMDGYAVAGDGPWLLRNEIRYAGDGGSLTLGDGEAARIATGAHLPAGATAVVRDEFVRMEGGLVSRLPDAPVRDDARRRGEDWESGTVLAEAGTAVSPAVVSAAASGEVTELRVRGPLRVHIVLTGDEIRRTGPLREGQTRDSLGPVLPDFVRWCGATVVGEGHLRDTADGFDALFTGTDADAIVIVGATGGGAADQLRGALARAGAQVVVERVRCKPGGSQVAATLPDGRAVLGLPGNPVAAVSTLLVLLPAIVDGRTLRTPATPVTAPLANASEVVGDITRLLPARQDVQGRWLCDNTIRTAHLAGLVGRSAIAVVPPGAVDGDRVELLPLPR